MEGSGTCVRDSPIRVCLGIGFAPLLSLSPLHSLNSIHVKLYLEKSESVSSASLLSFYCMGGKKSLGRLVKGGWMGGWMDGLINECMYLYGVCIIIVRAG